MLFRSPRYEHAYVEGWGDTALPDNVWKGDELSRFVSPAVAPGDAVKTTPEKTVGKPAKSKRRPA